jgi:hypothetical protein
MQILLHIGRHKSGTSSIQKSLYYADNLVDYGYYYPKNIIKKGYAHHSFAESISYQRLKKYPDSNRNTVIDNAFKELLENLNPDKINIISSEAFQNCSPENVKYGLRHADVKVCVYIRNELEYLASSYAQRVHATDYVGTIEEYAKTFNIDYGQFLAKWKSVFTNVSVRLFDKKHLLNSDVVDDFYFNILSIDDNFKIKKQYGRENPSLSNELVEFKRIVNSKKLYQDVGKNKLYVTLGSLTEFYGAKYLLPEELKSTLLPKYTALQNEWGEKYLGVTEPFDYESVPSTTKNQSLSDNQFLAIKEKFNRLLAEKKV